MATCSSFLVIGIGKQDPEKAPYIVKIAGKTIDSPAQGEINGASGTLGKYSLIASPDDHEKLMPGEFKNGVLNTKGDVLSERLGGMSFPSIAAAHGWLNSPSGLYFTLRMTNVAIIATEACGPALTDADFDKNERK